MATAPSYMAPGSEFDLAQQQAARQHLLAQSLMQQSQESPQGRMVGEYYAAPSWTQGLAKMLQGYAGVKMNKDADQSLLDARSAYDTRNLNSSNDFMDKLTGTPAQSFQAPSNDASDTSQVSRPAAAADPDAALKIAMQNPQNPTLAGMGQSMLANKLSLAQTQSLFNMAGGDQAPSAAPAQTGSLPGMGQYLAQGSTSPASGAPQSGMQGVNPMAARLMMTNNPGLTKLGEAIQAVNTPTDLMKTMRASGINESSPLWSQILQANVAKTNYIAPVNSRPGAIVRDAITNQPLAFNPHVPDGYAPVFDATGNVTGLKPLTGAMDAIAATAKAGTTGIGQATPTVAYGPDNKPIFSTKAQDVERANGVAIAPGSAAPDQRLSAVLQADAVANGIKNPVSNITGAGNVATQQPGSYSPQLAPGVDKGANLAQDELSKSYSAQKEAHQQAQTTNSYLQNIVQEAQKAAVGPLSDKRQYVNGLLSLVGNEKATDAVTANNLLDKYSNQIVARLSSGGLGTDAARSILQSAYPNAKMNLPAITEAAANLRGANNMTIARTNLLAPFGDARDPSTYNQKAREFDQQADPRIYQLQSMNPAEQAAYVKKMPPAEAQEMLSRRQKLKTLGAL